MPPKTKNKKAVKTVVDGLSPEEMSKDQLEEHIVRLREELDREREERSFFQLERDKIQASWEISKRRLEEEKGELRNRQREREEAEARHQVEITASKARVKVLDQELRDLSLQHQLLQCGFEKVERERDEVLEKQTEAIQEVRQRSSLKHLLLEKKLAALTAAAEKQEAQLFAALAASDVEPSAGAR
uniref:Dynein regulatory complex subunit 4 n=1 Tax=Gasterosteus aculeatus aculeatus TaxID=481459 RepID=A0AAQ4R7E0_GASAC